MMIGGLLGGVLGDRYGRRTALLGSVLAFAVLTLAIAFVNSHLRMLGVLRFLAGVGLGGAMPNAATLASEYVPRRQRPFAVTLTIVCIPLGGVSPRARWPASWRPPTAGARCSSSAAWSRSCWPRVLWKVLPESPRYPGEPSRALARADADAAAHGPRRAGRRRRSSRRGASRRRRPRPSGVDRRACSRRAFLRDTTGLFGSFFFCLMVNYVVIQLAAGRC